MAKMQVLLNHAADSRCVYDVYATTKVRSRLEQTNGMTRKEVAELVRTATKKDIPLEFYYPGIFESKNVIGYTYPNDPTIYLNQGYRDSHEWDICAEVSNEFHETLHKLGFDHDYKATERRPYSVPYTGNRAIEHCCVDGKVAP